MNQSIAVTVLLVDDHAVVREGYRRLLEQAPDLAVCGEAATAAEAYRRYAELAPDVVVMDISLPDATGIEALRRLVARHAAARVLVFSIHEEPIFLDRAFRAGARGYITKSSAPDVLVDAVSTVARGGFYVSADIAQALALSRLSDRSSPLSALSSREFEVLCLLVRGRTLPEIAQALSLTYKTVANHQTALRRKLDVQTSTQLMRLALGEGLLDGRSDKRSLPPNPMSPQNGCAIRISE